MEHVPRTTLSVALVHLVALSRDTRSRPRGGGRLRAYGGCVAACYSIDGPTPTLVGSVEPPFAAATLPAGMGE
jgi:hypothetical protein